MVREHLVLAGGGHSHALVLRMWAMHPARRPQALITLVSRCSTALYSGMVPGLVAGLYSREQAAIDLRQLCQLAGVNFVQAEITGLDLSSGQLLLADRAALGFDWLSLDVGAEIAEEAGALAVKPLEPFLAWCDKAGAGPTAQPQLMGSGAAAVELALALRARGLQPALQAKPSGLALGSAAANRVLGKVLDAAGISNGHPSPGAGPAGATIACTGSRGPRWLAASGLPTDSRGRVRTDTRLVVEGHPRLLASGDCGVISCDPRPASGVWAVRAAPVLAANLQAAIAGRPLRRWRPQRRALQLLGDGGVSGPPRAIALWGPWALGPSRWLWQWKDRIDRRFMERFASLPALMGRRQGADSAAMACRGCAAKLAAEPLRAALQTLGPLRNDDAAVIGRDGSGQWLLQSVDGFPALLSDPWLNARLTTLHACSDLWACGAAVTSAQAVVTLPQLAPGLQSELLRQTLAGVRSVLEPLGAQLLGGHTLEARDALPGAGLSLMLTVNGSAPTERLWPKGPLGQGEVLILTRPVGSGVLFAAAMAAAAKPQWIDQALAVLQQSQAPLVELLAAHDCRACTDITGFGLLGHLGEMLAASPGGTRVQLDAAALAGLALPGALELLAAGHASTLAPANAQALALLEGPVSLQGDASAPLQQLLIDPQTCGPLLAAVPADRAAAAIAALHHQGFEQAAVIGQVMA
jgi:selenide,water dikinase